MLDFKFDWCNDMEIGVPIMDTQHKELFRIGRDVEQLIICHCIGVTNKQLLDIVLELREFVAYHFYHEEELMKKNNYSDFEHQKKAHDKIVQYTLGIDLKKLSQTPYEILCNIKEFLQDWIFGHILIDDAAFGRYMKENDLL
ncbi:bacteriohemerythrin [Anaerosporobacter sp.]|uniref:bacteriohemerythrin n=1 Tax=Anaerosporobacter sp. TaxID=1872529 RepID=UPI00286F0A3F|nr:hemerythrin family protein [Anaerosporobacter sp.]